MKISRAVLATVLCFAATRSAIALPLQALTVGGGPTPEMNQFAIESNVRYVDRLLKNADGKTILFADGNRQTRSVAYLDEGPRLTNEEMAFRWIFGEALSESKTRFRAPQIAKIDGPAQKAAFNGAMQKLSKQPDSQFLLYFTGHGEPNRNAGANYENNLFDLWRDETLSVRELASSLKTLPSDKPVVLVMVQCFSGAFGNLIFEGGDPEKAVVNRDFCGFFAAVKERPAAGCTPEIDEEEYHDFTSYFFAALSGRDRVGRAVSNADYNRNGQVGMDEAFAYAMINENSIDIPVSTSDVYLRRVIELPIEQVTATSYARVVALAAPWQKAALEGLSKRLKLSGDGRIKQVWQELERLGQGGQLRRQFAWPPAIVAKRDALRAALQTQFVGLKADRRSPIYSRARRAAIANLKARDLPTNQLLKEVGQAFSQMNGEADEAREARLYRFLRLARTILLEESLQAKGQPAQKAVFERLRKSEARNPLQS